MRPLLAIRAWSCHTSQCRVLSKSFNLAHNSSGSPSASGSLRKQSLSLSSSDLSQLYSLYVLTLMYFSFFNTLFSLISDNRYFGNFEEELPKPTVGRLSTDNRPTVGRQMVNSRPTVYQQIVDRLLAVCRSTVGDLSVSCR